MIREGEPAPTFELPAVHDGEVESVALEEYRGSTVVVLAFYPGDFNPACDAMRTGLDDLDIFTMQRDVAVLAVSGDSIFSHRAFADEYGLHIPLLSDRWGEVASAYGVAADDERYRTRRAVFVVDHDGVVEFVWAADEPEELPDVDAVRTAVENVGDDETAHARYRSGHTSYGDGKEAFTAAMAAFDDREWLAAEEGFAAAADAFDEAFDAFETAVRFAEGDRAGRWFELATRKAESRWRAADWLRDAASAFASGEGAAGQALREDAETPLEAARELPELPAPDAVDEVNAPPGRTEVSDGQLALETDEAEDPSAVDDGSPPPGWGEPTTPPGTDADAVANDEAFEAGDTEPGGIGIGEESGETDTGDSSERKERGDESAIDDDELAAITAELEEQNESERVEPRSSAGDDASEAAEDELEDGELELDLTDPTEEDTDDGSDSSSDEEVDDDLGGGGHGVPDSL